MKIDGCITISDLGSRETRTVHQRYRASHV